MCIDLDEGVVVEVEAEVVVVVVLRAGSARVWKAEMSLHWPSDDVRLSFGTVGWVLLAVALDEQR